MSLCDLAVHFVDHAEAEGAYSADTARDYRGMVLRYVRPNVTADADELTALDVEVLYALLLAKGGATETACRSAPCASSTPCSGAPTTSSCARASWRKAPCPA